MLSYSSLILLSLFEFLYFKAIYLDKLQKIILTGTPKATAWEESNMIEGREMIFLLDKDRFVANNRVRMKIYPKDKEKEDK